MERLSLFLVLSAFAGFAQSADCDKPPYGDTPENYQMIVSQNKQAAAKYDPSVGKMLFVVAALAMQSACEVKFQNGDRSNYHKLGITDEAIAVTSPVGLAMQEIALTSKRDLKEHHEEPTYQPVSVRNFVIDGPKLAADHAYVALTGFYILQGNAAFLYTDSQAVIMARYHSNVGTQPSVALDATHASHQLRSTLVSCDSNPGEGQVGCKIDIRGRADMCTATSAFGASREMPCLIAEDGKRH
jgi:hypothetical protein